MCCLFYFHVIECGGKYYSHSENSKSTMGTFCSKFCQAEKDYAYVVDPSRNNPGTVVAVEGDGSVRPLRQASIVAMGVSPAVFRHAPHPVSSLPRAPWEQTQRGESATQITEGSPPQGIQVKPVRVGEVPMQHRPLQAAVSPPSSFDRNNGAAPGLSPTTAMTGRGAPPKTQAIPGCYSKCPDQNDSCQPSCITWTREPGASFS